MNNIIKKYYIKISECSKGGSDGDTPLVDSDSCAFYLDGFARNEVFSKFKVQFAQTIDALFTDDKYYYYIEFCDSNINDIHVNEIEGKIVSSLIIIEKYLDINVFCRDNKYFVLVVKNNLEKLVQYVINLSGIKKKYEYNKAKESFQNMLLKYNRVYFNFFTINNESKFIMTANEFKEFILKE